MTKAQQILEYVKVAGREGRTTRECQQFIFDLNWPNLAGSNVMSQSYYWGSLMGEDDHVGLLPGFCSRNQNTSRWIVTEPLKPPWYRKKHAS